MPLQLVPLLLAGGAALLLFGSHQAEFSHLPKPLAEGIRQNLANNKNAVQLRQLAASLRMAAAQATLHGDSRAVADYNRAADALDKRAADLSGGTGDPVTQATDILTQAGPDAAQIPTILSSTPAASATPPIPPPPVFIPPSAIPPTPTPPFVPPPVAAPAPMQIPGFPGTPPIPVALPQFPFPTAPPVQIPGFPGTPPLTPPGLPPTAPATYVVADGDFPYKIAARFGISLGALASANPAHKSDIVNGKIFAGQTLNLPPSAHDHGPQNHAFGQAA